jgi:hypothetical protein
MRNVNTGRRELCVQYRRRTEWRLRMARTIWSSPDNPPHSVAGQLGMARRTLGNRLHKIKQAAGLSGADRVSIEEDGTVRNDRGDEIGNLHDED